MMKFVENRKKFYAVSIVVIVIGLLTMCINGVRGVGAFNQGIEFTGGSLIQVDMGQPLTNELKNELSVLATEITENEDARITSAGDTGVIIKMSRTEEDKRTALFEAIKEEYGLESNALLEDKDFSASISSDIKWGAIKAVVVGTILILIYITFRFKDYKFGMSAVIALIHDVLVMLAVYALFRIPLNNSFIAAMLTIVGYSINDTIIVFDRIRENKERKGIKEHEPVQAELVDDSINMTMGRSINTSLTTLVMVILLFILGTDSVKEFAFPIIVGVIAGTYSSVFIASPLWYEFTHLKNSEGKPSKKLVKDNA